MEELIFMKSSYMYNSGKNFDSNAGYQKHLEQLAFIYNHGDSSRLSKLLEKRPKMVNKTFHKEKGSLKRKINSLSN